MCKKLAAIFLLFTLGYFIGISHAAARDPLEISTISEDGFIHKDDGGYTRFNAETYIRIGGIIGDPDYYRGYILFNTTGQIPAGAIIDAVYLGYYLTDNSPYNMPTRAMAYQPSLRTDQQVYNDAADGTTYISNTVNRSLGYHELVLNGAVPEFNASLGWFSVGFENSGIGNRADISSDEAANNPILLVYYHFSTDYNYNLSGPYYENGTRSAPVVTTISGQGYTTTITVNGLNITYYADKPLISWDLGGGLTRKFYTVESENITVTIPDGSINAYSFEFRDYGARIGDSDTYLEAVKTINGSETVIERNIIYNSESPSILNLVTGQTYTIRVRFSDGSYYTFGYYTPDGSTAPPTINIYGVTFDNQFQPRAKWINVEIERPTDTQIKTTYNNTLAGYDTLNLTVYYMHRNGTLIGINHTVAENHVFNWPTAVNTTHYLVTLQVEHEYYGVFNVTALLGGAYDYATPPQWSILGINLELISVFIILAVSGTVSKLYNYLGVLAAAIVAALLVTAGWVFIPTWLITLAAIIGIGTALREAR